MDFDVIIYDTCGGPFSAELEKEKLLGGSELLLVQLAEALKTRGHTVLAIGNGPMRNEAGYVSHLERKDSTLSCQTLLVSRYSSIPSNVKAERIVGVATDTAGDYLKKHLVVASSDWQASELRARGFKKVTRIYNMLGPIPKVGRSLGGFVFASGPMKGRAETLAKWTDMKSRKSIPPEARLLCVSPGWGDPISNGLYIVPQNSADYRRIIAESEGLFFVSSGLPETYGNVAAIAERAGVKCHILCRSGFGGLKEATSSKLVTDDEEQFEMDFVQEYGTLAEIPEGLPDHSPEALVGAWEEALGLKTSVPAVYPIMSASAGGTAGSNVPFYRPEDLVPLQEVFDGEYDFPELSNLKAPRVLDIGANVGAFTRWILARCPGAKVTAYEPTPQHCELFRRNNPDVELIEAAVTIQKNPVLFAGAGNSGMNSLRYVAGLTRTDAIDVKGIHPGALPHADLVKVDTEGCELEILSSYQHLITVKSVLLEYHTAVDRDEIAKILKSAGLALVEHKPASWAPERAGIQKWYRKEASIEKVLGKSSSAVSNRIPPRADCRPTVGLVMISKGDEGATIIARAIVSALKVVDCVTVVADGGAQTIEVCSVLGAEVHQRPTPPINWETGVGLFAAARNEALEIAEPRTDYVMFLDPDDWYEGELPSVLDKDIYELVIYDSGIRYPRPQLYRSSKHFRYVGIIHETITGSGTLGRIESLKYVRGHGGHQDQKGQIAKFTQHAKWLEKWLLDHPEDARAQFYLGQSYRDAQDYEKALVAYERRIAMGGWEEERAFAAAQVARIIRDTGRDPTMAYLRAFELRPTRAEPLVELATWLRDEKQKRFALALMVARQACEIQSPAGDVLFLEPTVYQFRALEELAIALYWTGDKKASRECYERLQTLVPEAYKPHMKAMLELIVRELGSS